MLKIMGKAQVSGRNYGQKIISILNAYYLLRHQIRHQKQKRRVQP